VSATRCAAQPLTSMLGETLEGCARQQAPNTICSTSLTKTIKQGHMGNQGSKQTDSNL
jgi:hypothetical protein